jgi:methionyl-tRNA formyltransferase
VELKLVFLGTPEFAVPSLERLVMAEHDVAAVFTQPDRPKGRGQQLEASPVKRAAQRLGLPVHQPEKIRRPEIIELLARLRLDAMVVVGYGQIIPQTIIDIPPLGIINVHASLLPKYRGAAPIQWAIANGETRTGVTTMKIDAGLDTGGILLTWETEIGPDETAPELSERLASAGADLLARTLQGFAAGAIEPRKQNSAEATYAPILKKEDGRIDWQLPAPVIYNRLRGFQPWPGAYTHFRGLSLHIGKARVVEEATAGSPGSLHPTRRRLLVACGGDTTLELLEVQLEGRKKLSAAAFLNGQHLAQNEKLGEGT